MVSFEMQLHELNRAMALRITKMLTEKHNFDITEIYGEQSKSSAEEKQRYLYITNEWGPESPKKNPDNLTPQDAGMSKGRCPI